MQTLACDVNFLLETLLGQLHQMFLSLVVIHHHLFTCLAPVCFSNRIESSVTIKIYFDQKEDTALPNITEKIKLPIYFSQATSQLKISLVLLATDAVSEQSTVTLHII